METKVRNIAEILKDCPKGTELYSPIFGNVKFECIEKGSPFLIKVIDINLGINRALYFDKYGRINIGSGIPSKECSLFPSEDQRDWSKFKKPIKPPFEIPRIYDGRIYYYVDDCGYILSRHDYNKEFNIDNWNIGNYFNTREQAEYASGKVKELLLSLRKEDK